MNSLLGGFIISIAALSYVKLLKPITKLELEMQRILVIFAVLTIFIPLFSLTDVNTVYVAIPLVIACVLTYIGYALGSKLLYFMSVVAGLINIFSLLVNASGKIAIPIFLFIFGFIAIGVSIVIAKMGHVGKDVNVEEFTQNIGFVGDQEGRGLSHIVDNGNTFIMVFLKIILIILAAISIYTVAYSLSYDKYGIHGSPSCDSYYESCGVNDTPVYDL